MVAVPLLKKPDRYLPWNVVLHSIDGNTITVNVITPSDAIVARWRLDVDTKIINDGAYSYSWETKIYLLFNPWLVPFIHVEKIIKKLIAGINTIKFT